MTEKTLVGVFVEQHATCPGCHQRVDVMHGNSMPKVGDWNVCANDIGGAPCLAVCIFTEVGKRYTFRLATPEEFEADVSKGLVTDQRAIDMLRMAFAERARRLGRSG